MKKTRMTTLLALALACTTPILPAVAADEAPDYIEAMHKWRPKAEAGDTEAQFQLGQMYALSYGLEQDFKTAAEWYAKSAEQGNAKARTALALCYEYGYGVAHNAETARAWIEKAAAQDFPPAQVAMGGLAEKEKDYAKARKWYELAAAQGNAEAMANIGDLYKDGNGVKKDIKQAIQ
ncbi:tetratricopeptide repeat protein [Cardiobacterium hominis]